MSRRVVLVAGTRPEFVKLQPVALALAAREVACVLIATDQHSSGLMKGRFLEELPWPCPVESLSLDARPPLVLLAQIFTRLPARLRPDDLVVVEGDTTSVLAAALVANKLQLSLAHVEAGLRSYDLRMPEEHNRRMCDHLANYLFAPTTLDAGHLNEEKCTGEISITGNTVLDAVRQNIGRAERSEGSGYVLLTLHRQENVGDEAFLLEILRFLESSEVPALFPVHPRTEERLRALSLWDRFTSLANLRLCEPMGYLAFLGALAEARVVITDSGGVQEETTAPEIRRPTIVLRRSTERVAALDAGFSILASPDAHSLRLLVEDLSWFHPAATSPFGDGYAADKIANTLAHAVQA